MQEGRLFQIIYYILENGKTTIPELAEKLEVSERTVYRDMDALSAAGIPVYMERGRNGGVRLMEGFALSRELFSEQERKELLSALQSLSAAGAYDTALLGKISALFQVSSQEWCEVDFSRWGEQARDNEKFEVLKQAVIYHRAVRMVYVGAGGKEGARTIWPLKLSYRSRAWYLKAWCTKKQDFRLFKLHRILEWELLEEFTPPSNWEGKENGAGGGSTQKKVSVSGTDQKVSQKIGTALKMPSMEEPSLVQLRFPREMAYRVYDEFEESQVRQEEDGNFLVAVPMPVDDWVISFLLSFGTQVEVVEPAYLRERLADKIMELYEKYKILNKT